MRLLNARTIAVEDFSPGKIPRYAILSHTWEDGEISFEDIERQTVSSKAGYAKLLASCKQALLDGLDYVWIDTCCIDKTSSAELSEAINAIRHDIDERSPFAKSRWYNRGWTLQELLAPADFVFYSQSWQRLGTKAELRKIISHVCGIGEPFLVGERPLAMASVAARMSWAAQRETTREEDRAYSLLGVFGVHIPLLYGEGGQNAFIRLQEELVRTSDDQTIFAWHWYGPYREDDYNLPWLASSPSDFLGCHDIVVCNRIQLPSHFFMTNTGIRMELPIVFDNESRFRRTFALLECRKSMDYRNTFAVPVVIRGDKCIRADPSTVLFDRSKAKSRSILFKLHLETSRSHRSPTQSLISSQKTAMLVLRSLPPGYRIHNVVPPAGWTAWSDGSGCLCCCCCCCI
ncbi:het domain protein [Colletotrichum plurivorum]|uniref:Het domain protein n=1 Tax=Colletotrichum plurivorum TaxID=2175906 RepID=A0A8H6JAZ0_9PEZI|nr:het domain protein [Colletotrichum plurivorum]